MYNDGIVHSATADRRTDEGTDWKTDGRTDRRTTPEVRADTQLLTDERTKVPTGRQTDGRTYGQPRKFVRTHNQTLEYNISALCVVGYKNDMSKGGQTEHESDTLVRNQLEKV